ncbi:G2/mitotic-specific cyclin-B3 isoform X2 [Aethina tumida]|uniref:G2/mitotic-specific cyclin-B3 isoform X2 n=1 Tax=Aethina tumida TaxID=116153 RepID=UPI00096B4D65|nr:G2/mitotic-specific cyclin-B3 isoform X2 [Aethina tumida]
MAPIRNSNQQILTGIHTVATRSRTIANSSNHSKDVLRGKRKADGSPSKEKVAKRSAFGDVSNVLEMAKHMENGKATVKTVAKKVTVQSKVLASVKTVTKPRQNENLAPPPAPAHKILTRAASKVSLPAPNQTAAKPKDDNKENKENGQGSKIKTRLSNEFEKTEESLYSSALEDNSNDSTYFSAKKPSATGRSKTSSESSKTECEENRSVPSTPSNVSIVAKEMEAKLNLGNHEVPENVEDYDKEHWDDVYQVSHYAMDIFNYYKERESHFKIPDYMDRQVCLTTNMRALLVDWMVEIQESFELNHETLYLGVKLVDMYLSRITVGKDTLQLVGAAAMFIASKYDERMPPMIDDFLYICDGAYTRRELIRMEISILKVCQFDLGIPISYRFLRRYARVTKITMPVLTLARYILETSLMNYATVTIRDSILASASLFLALKMKNISGWTPALEFYTGYKYEDIKSTVQLLNNGLHKPISRKTVTVKNKYSHKIFFEVAKTPLISNENL